MPRQLPEKMINLNTLAKGDEQKARKMLLAGADWLEAHPEAAMVVKGTSGPRGEVVGADNEATAEIRRVVAAAADGAPPAQQGIVVHMLQRVQAGGWDAFVALLAPREKKAARPALTVPSERETSPEPLEALEGNVSTEAGSA